MTRFFKRVVLLFFLSLLIFAKVNFAQNSTGGQLLSGDTIYPKHKVMIIPFNMYNYFSDADPELAQKNEKDVTDISTLFRYGLNYNISARVISAYDPYNILVDTTLQSGQDLNMIYASIKYQFEKPMDVNAKDSAANKTIKQPVLQPVAHTYNLKLTTYNSFPLPPTLKLRCTRGMTKQPVLQPVAHTYNL